VQAPCCKYLHYCLAIFGILLVLFVIMLISVETYRSVKQAGLNSTSAVT
jgi:hypothetical protein